ncbi:unnamed protein product [Lathyrus sativus]|nr:unnamed protein product [Lathyrus sativus]
MGSETNNARSGKTAAIDVVATVKEIVNCTEQEIYDVLKDCDMDPNLAVEKLLAQDTFREVRSKREKRKEMKEAVDSRTRGNSTGLSRGGKIGIGNDPGVVQNGFHHMAYKENGKAVDKQDVGSVCASVTSSTTHVAGKSTKVDSLYTDNGRQSLGTGVSMSDTAQVSPAPLPRLVGASKGHLSMADIVRMGTTSQDAVSHDHCNSIGVSSLSGNSESSLSLPCQNSSEQQSFHDEWPVIEQPISGNAQTLNMNHELDAAQVSREEIARDNAISEKIESASISDYTELGPHSNSNLKNTLTSDFSGSYEHREGVSSVTLDLQRLNMKEANLEVPSSDDIVVLPNHLQALAAECSHLSFGTYKGGNNSASSEAFTPNNLSRDGLEMKSATVDGPLAQLLKPSSQNLGDQLGFDILRGTPGDQNYGLHSTLGHEYNTTASISDPSLQKSQWMVPSLPLKQPCVQSGNHSSFPGELHNSSNAVPQDLLAYLLAESRRSKHNAEPSINNFPLSMSGVSRDIEPGTFALHNRPSPAQGFTVQPNNHFQQSREAYYALPQNQSYMATIDSRRAFSDNTAYSGSHANMNYNSLPQNRNEFMSRLHPSTVSDAPGYGNPDSSLYCPGSFQPNASLGNMKPSSNLNEILTSQYYGGHNLSSVQPHDSFSQRDYETRLRSSYVPEKTQYIFPDQPSQASLSQYASHEYSDFYPSWSQIPEEHKQSGSVQDLLPRKLHQFWPHNQ